MVKDTRIAQGPLPTLIGRVLDKGREFLRNHHPGTGVSAWRPVLGPRRNASVAGEQGSGSRGPAIVFMPYLQPGGGAERYAVVTAAALAERGYDDVILANVDVTHTWLEYHYGLDLSGVRIHRIKDFSRMERQLPVALCRLIEDWIWKLQLRPFHADLFINCASGNETPGTARTNIYVCHFPHRREYQCTTFLHRLYMGVMTVARKVLVTWTPFPHNYQMVVANSHFTSGHVSRLWNVDSMVLPPSCPTMAVDGVAKGRDIITVGRFEPVVPKVPNKRFDVLVDAFAGMEDLHREGWKLHVVGACPPAKQQVLDGLRRRAGSAPVEFHPNVDFQVLRELYSRATMYWHAQGCGEDADADPKTQEHFGITTVEAMSAGCVPVVYATAGPREVAEGLQDAGLWRTVEELRAETVRIAHLSEDDREAASQAARERATGYDHEHFSDHLMEIIDRARTQS